MAWIPAGVAMAISDSLNRIEHHSAGGVYMRQQALAAGEEAEKHQHTYDHLSFLVSGSAIVDIEGEIQHLAGPAALEVKAGKKHRIQAITDIVWLCIHSEVVADPEISKE